MAYRRACRIGVDSHPEQVLAAAMRWGAWAARRQAWHEAAEAYDWAITSMRHLFTVQTHRRDKESWLRDATQLPQAAALALVRTRDVQRAVAILDGGRAMLLTEALQSAGRPTNGKTFGQD